MKPTSSHMEKSKQMTIMTMFLLTIHYLNFYFFIFFLIHTNKPSYKYQKTEKKHSESQHENNLNSKIFVNNDILP